MNYYFMILGFLETSIIDPKRCQKTPEASKLILSGAWMLLDPPEIENEATLEKQKVDTWKCRKLDGRAPTNHRDWSD